MFIVCFTPAAVTRDIQVPILQLRKQAKWAKWVRLLPDQQEMDLAI